MTYARDENVRALAQAFGRDVGTLAEQTAEAAGAATEALGTANSAADNALAAKDTADAIAPNVRKITTDAGRAPLPSDDETQGYEVGSRWQWEGREWVRRIVDGAAEWSLVDAGALEAAALADAKATPFTSYASALTASKPAAVTRVGAFVNGRLVEWIRQSGGPCLGGGWVPAAEVLPEHFGDNAEPGVTDMGAAIQAAYDFCFATGREMHHGKLYASSIPLSPIQAQGTNPGNFEMPYVLHFHNTEINFIGTGHSSDIAWSIINVAYQRSVRNGQVNGTLKVINNGDWGKGVVLRGCNFWRVNGGFCAGRSGAPASGFAEAGVSYESNDGKGGLWNSWGDAYAYYSDVCINIGAIANANRFGMLFALHPGTGGVNLAGSRLSVGHISVEIGDNDTAVYGIRNSGQFNTFFFEIEKASGSVPLGPGWKAGLWITDEGNSGLPNEITASVEATGSFWALPNSSRYLIEGDSIADLMLFRQAPGARWERITTRTEEAGVNLRRPARKVSTSSISIGVDNTFGPATQLLTGDFRSTVDLRNVRVVNSADRSVRVQLTLTNLNGTPRTLSTVSVPMGETYDFPEGDIAAALADGDIINTVSVQANVGGSSVTGQVTVSALAYLL